MTAQERVLLGVIEYNEAKRLQARLEELGVRLELISNPSTCGSGGCKPTLEAWFDSLYVPVVQQFLRDEAARAHEGLAFNPELMNEVFDSEAESARCPACGTSFSTQLKECPDCGLVFISD